jgi:outer membrane immunogenic protein
MMNRICMIALAAFAAIDTGAAQAAPLAERAYNWTGVYTGVHAGYGVASTEWTSLPHQDTGAIGGVQLGYNQQIGNLLFGIEGDFTLGGIRGGRSLEALGQVSFHQNSRINWLATATGRVGFARGSWLAYAKAGVAWADEDHAYDINLLIAPGGSYALSGGEGRRGWIVGAGVEHALGGNWSIRAEYNFINFAKHTLDLSGTDNSGATFQSSAETTQTLHLAKLGVNYQFGAPAEAKPFGPLSYTATEFDWTGFYIGAQAGYGASRTNWRDYDPYGEIAGTGGFAGGQIGADVQLGVAVFGVEAELVGGRISGGNTYDGAPFSVDVKSRTEWLAMATARFGMVTNERWLTYVKAGVAAAQDQHDVRLSLGPDYAEVGGSRIHTGLVVGAGVEYAFARNWSAKLEYDYINFGTEQPTLEGTANIPPLVGSYYSPASIEKTMQIGKVGVNYHFVP